KGGGKWIITDEAGTRFIFGQKELEKETNTTYYKEPSDADYVEGKTYVSTWYISEITSGNGIELASFEYQGGEDIQNSFFVDRKSDIISQDCDKPAMYAERFHYKTVAEPKYIKKINSRSGNVHFSYGSNRR